MIRHAQPIARALVATVAAVGLLSGSLPNRAPAAGSSQGQAATFAQTRTISFYHIHTKETLTVTYKKNGEFVPEALEKINWIMRDWRKNQSTKMDPNTIDIIWEMHEELGSNEPVNIICGYRSHDTNEMLRRTFGGQASQSQHITGKAIDITFPDVPLRRMRYSAMIRERGGVGYYPTSGVPFVHVDTARVRHWPRMLRDELALIFPSGHSEHQPADGGPLTPGDAARARARNPELATEVAAFFDVRNNYGQRPAVMVASAEGAPSPSLKQPDLKQVALTEPVLKQAAIPATRPVAQTTRPPLPEGRMAVGAPPPDTEQLVWQASVRPAGDEAEASPTQTEARPMLTALVTAPTPAQRPKDKSSTFAKADAGIDRKALDKLVLAALTTGATSKSAPAKTDPQKSAKSQPANANSAKSEKPAPVDGAALAGAGLGSRVTWVQAPVFDDDHPDDSAYNPFPVAPMMTETSSVDDPALTGLVHPDASKALALISEDAAVEPIAIGSAEPPSMVEAQAFAQTAAGPAPSGTSAQAVAAGPLHIAQRTVTTVGR